MKRKAKKRSYVVLEGTGDPCPRCGGSTEIRAHPVITETQLRRAYYYSQWFNCMNPRCRTSLIMPERFKVWNLNPEQAARLKLIQQQLGEDREDEDCADVLS